MQIIIFTLKKVHTYAISDGIRRYLTLIRSFHLVETTKVSLKRKNQHVHLKEKLVGALSFRISNQASIFSYNLQHIRVCQKHIGHRRTTVTNLLLQKSFSKSLQPSKIVEYVLLTEVIFTVVLQANVVQKRCNHVPAEHILEGT